MEVDQRTFDLLTGWILQRDLSAVTDKLWKKFYEKEFGVNSTNLVCERMKDKKVSFEWKLLYEVIIYCCFSSLALLSLV